MKKVLLNKCYGGFGVSDAAYQLYAKEKGLTLFKYIMETDEQGRVIYKKTENTKNVIYFTQDMGNNVEISEEDFRTYNLYLNGNYREDLALIEAVERLGEAANTDYSNLIIVRVPADMVYVIDDYDGRETLHEAVEEF